MSRAVSAPDLPALCHACVTGTGPEGYYWRVPRPPTTRGADSRWLCSECAAHDPGKGQQSLWIDAPH